MHAQTVMNTATAIKAGPEILTFVPWSSMETFVFFSSKSWISGAVQLWTLCELNRLNAPYPSPNCLASSFHALKRGFPSINGSYWRGRELSYYAKQIQHSHETGSLAVSTLMHFPNASAMAVANDGDGGIDKVSSPLLTYTLHFWNSPGHKISLCACTTLILVHI